MTWTVEARKRAGGRRPVLEVLRSSEVLPTPHLESRLVKTPRGLEGGHEA